MSDERLFVPNAEVFRLVKAALGIEHLILQKFVLEVDCEKAVPIIYIKALPRSGETNRLIDSITVQDVADVVVDEHGNVQVTP